jgi:hypothetical protein
MCVCLRVCVCQRLHVCACVGESVCECVYVMCVCVCACVSESVCECVYVWSCTRWTIFFLAAAVESATATACVYVCMCLCDVSVCVCEFVCLFVCVYVMCVYVLLALPKEPQGNLTSLGMFRPYRITPKLIYFTAWLHWFRAAAFFVVSWQNKTNPSPAQDPCLLITLRWR